MIVRNWKTTVGGILAALGTSGVLAAFGAPPDADKALAAAGIAILGLGAKDSNVTGGTVQQ